MPQDQVTLRTQTPGGIVEVQGTPEVALDALELLQRRAAAAAKPTRKPRKPRK